MERKIGEKFEYNGKIYVVLKSNRENCNNCAAIRGTEQCVFFDKCHSYSRKDGENVTFREVTIQPFDVELARLGKQIVTRGGEKARIICFDRENPLGYHIVALIGEEESVGLYNDYGMHIDNKIGEESEQDLMMEAVMYDGWMAIVRCPDGCGYGEIATAHIYSTVEELRKNVKKYGVERDVVCVMPVGWGE